MIPAGYAVDPVTGIVLGKRGKPIRKTARGGYLQLNTRKGHVGMAHRVVWEYVNGPIPAGMQINHINGITSDNRIVNLELVTPAENSRHAFRIGLSSYVGERNGRAKLSEDDVRAIRESADSSRILANRFGVSRRTVQDIRTGRRWSHVA